MKILSIDLYFLTYSHPWRILFLQFIPTHYVFRDHIDVVYSQSIPTHYIFRVHMVFILLTYRFILLRLLFTLFFTFYSFYHPLHIPCPYRFYSSYVLFYSLLYSLRSIIFLTHDVFRVHIDVSQLPRVSDVGVWFSFLLFDVLPLLGQISAIRVKNHGR